MLLNIIQMAEITFWYNAGVPLHAVVRMYSIPNYIQEYIIMAS